jgi:fructoselysine 3-epimerase
MTTVRGNSISFHAYPVETACRRIAALGYNSVEMWKDHLAGFKTPELLGLFREYAASLGLELFGLNVVGAPYFQPFGNTDNFERTLQGLKDDVDFALALGVHEVMVWEGVKPQESQASRDELLETVVALFQEAITYARPRGARFLAEPHPFTLGMDLDFAIALCDRLDASYFGLLFDFCHFGVGKPDGYVEAVRKLGHRIQHLHFSDSDLRTSELHFPPGKGVMDMDAVIKALKEVRFNGTITMDLYSYPLPEQGSQIGIPRLKQAIEELGLT